LAGFSASVPLYFAASVFGGYCFWQPVFLGATVLAATVSESHFFGQLLFFALC
jgi:hypothetical protein